MMKDTTAKQKLTEADYQQAALAIGVDAKAIKAVKAVESGAQGAFLDDGRATILFEGHIFWQQLKKRGIDIPKFAHGNSDILYPHWTKKFYKGGAEEYQRLLRAVSIHEEAALSSASWGMFQVMGFNHAACGCASAKELSEKMQTSEKSQLMLWLKFLQNSGLTPFLRKRQWAEFARRYNGSGYKANHYDTRLAAAFAALCHG